ncbi:hypothetical protein GMMP15_1410020 [Candidatus Magnetomoraceae bacterium gMMP-15]
MKIYDVFLSYADKDKEFANKLATSLRDKGVNVWFDKWELKAGNLLFVKLNEGLEKSKKMIALWSQPYFTDNRVRLQSESFFYKQLNVFDMNRPLLPVLLEDCKIPTGFRSINFIDCRNHEDFELKLHEILKSLDLPENRKSKKNIHFQNQIATLYSLAGFRIKKDILISKVPVNFAVQKKISGFSINAIIECKNKIITHHERDWILKKHNIIQKTLPGYAYIIISYNGFAIDIRDSFETSGISCLSCRELMHSLVPLDSYVKKLIFQYKAWTRRIWHGKDLFIRPDLKAGNKNHHALPYFAKWLDDINSNVLVISGDTGLGKTSFIRFLANHLALSFQNDPMNHPAPVLINLKNFYKKFSLNEIVLKHFKHNNFHDINFKSFLYLLEEGRIILFLDGFDEIADFSQWKVIWNELNKLHSLKKIQGKIIITCSNQCQFFEEIKAELNRQQGAELIELQKLNKEQIIAYLKRLQPDAWKENKEIIQKNTSLKKLSQFNILLNMIIRCLPELKKYKNITEVDLYTVFTNRWINHNENNILIANKKIRLAIMLQISWIMRRKRENIIHYNDLIPFLKKIVNCRSNENLSDILKEIKKAEFLIQDEKGNFSFIHRNFMEFFLAKRLYYIFMHSDKTSVYNKLNIQNFNQKTIDFFKILNKK